MSIGCICLTNIPSAGICFMVKQSTDEIAALRYLLLGGLAPQNAFW